MPEHRELAEFVDINGWRWRFDVTWFASGYGCIYGRGCPSTLPSRGKAMGCCGFGVYVVQDENDPQGRADLARLGERIIDLTDEEWQHSGVARAIGTPFKEREKGTVHTRIHNGACIFHNDPEWPGGGGCAFHAAALGRGEDPLDWKPRACWTVPIMIDEDSDARSTYVYAMSNLDWGSNEYEPLEWWCIDDAIAYKEAEPAYKTLAAELRRQVGDDIYEQFAAYMDAYMLTHEIVREPVGFRNVPGSQRPNGTTGIPLPMAEGLLPPLKKARRPEPAMRLEDAP